MAEIPLDWKLSKKKREDGRVDLLQPVADGTQEVALTTAGADVSDGEVADLASRYQKTAKEWMNETVLPTVERNKREYEDKVLDDYMEPALAVSEGASFKRTFGWSREYAAGWERAFGI